MRRSSSRDHQSAPRSLCRTLGSRAQHGAEFFRACGSGVLLFLLSEHPFVSNCPRMNAPDRQEKFVVPEGVKKCVGTPGRAVQDAAATVLSPVNPLCLVCHPAPLPPLPPPASGCLTPALAFAALQGGLPARHQGGQCRQLHHPARGPHRRQPRAHVSCRRGCIWRKFVYKLLDGGQPAAHQCRVLGAGMPADTSRGKAGLSTFNLLLCLAANNPPLLAVSLPAPLFEPIPACLPAGSCTATRTWFLRGTASPTRWSTKWWSR